MPSRKQRYSDAVVPGELVQDQLHLKNVLALAQNAERGNRKVLLDTFFPDAPKGSHSLDADDGRTVSATFSLEYKVDEGALDFVRKQMQEEFGVNVDAMFNWKPSLKMALYKELSDEERAVFDQCLTITEGSPQLKITEPKGWVSPYPDERMGDEE